MAQPWFSTATAPLNQLPSTIGQGVSSSGGGTGATTAAQQAYLESIAAEAARQADQNYAQRKQELDNTYAINVRNARTQEEKLRIDRDYNTAQVQLAKERLAQEESQFSRTFGLQQQEFGLNQAKLGYDVLGTAAQLRGPANVFQAADYSRGVSSNPGTPTFLTALQNNTGLTGFGAQGGLPAPETLGTLTAKLGGDPSGGVAGPSSDMALAAIGNIAAKGAHQLAPGSLESLNPDEMGIFTSGLDKLGINKDTFLNQYRQSRIGNNYSLARAA